MRVGTGDRVNKYTEFRIDVGVATGGLSSRWRAKLLKRAGQEPPACRSTTRDMKTSTIAILLAAAALNTANALKCHKNATGVLATWEDTEILDSHVGFGWTQYYHMKDGKLAKSNLPGEEYDFYECEAPEKFYKWGGGVLKTKDGKKCLTNSFIREQDPSHDGSHEIVYKQVPENVEKKVTLEDCAEGGMELRKQWFLLGYPERKGCPVPLYKQGHQNDETMDLSYGPQGVAFDKEGGLGYDKSDKVRYFHRSQSYLMTANLDATCVYKNPVEPGK